jgi:hypothetical protein
MDFTDLQRRIADVRRRWLWIGSTAALAWGALAALGLVIAGVWLDLVWELSPQMRIAALVTSAAGGVLLLCVLVGMAYRAARDADMARRLDQAGGLGGDILTGWELAAVDAGVTSRTSQTTDHPQSTRDMARLAVAHAARLAKEVPTAAAVNDRPLKRSLVGLAIAVLGILLVVASLPGLARTAWLRFSDPYADVPPFARTGFKIEPGDARVRYGDGLDIYATPEGAPVERLELVLRPIGSAATESVPMFPDADGRWRAVLAKVTEPAEYFVRAHHARSFKHRIDVILVPEFEKVHVRITPPAYTGDAVYSGPVPKEGISGLPGTIVDIRATSNRPLSASEMEFKPAAAPGGSVSVNGAKKLVMTADPSNPLEAVGKFEIEQSGKLDLRLADVDGNRSRDVYSLAVTRLTDQRPFIRIMQPREESLATPTANLPVEISAEDDYGISRVQLFRSLNDSRPLATDVRKPEKPLRRLGEKVFLPLGQYRLEPGDVIKLFARVEDTDPAAAKGSESTVVTVRIISQEEFEKMVRVRQGLEVLMSKYNQAKRRMEGLAGEMEQLRSGQTTPAGQEGEAKNSENKLDEAKREKLRELAKRMRDEAKAIEKAGDHMLPYDVDEALTEQLAKAAASLESAAADLEKLAGAPQTTEQEQNELLKKLAEQLQGARNEFDKQASEPLAHLGKLFPLIADQNRFLKLASQQRDLAERLATYKDQELVNDPAAKARLRDLEAEQSRVRSDLEALLTDIENHAKSLPEDPQLEKLRASALTFAGAVRASGASEAMTDAETALTEFAGAQGHKKATEAADLLAKFIGQCNGVGDGAGQCLNFQPTLSQCLGNTVSQLLAEMGMGSGSGGMGGGAGGGGYSARRGPGVGLYGSLPTLGGGDFASGGGQQGADQGPSGSGIGRPGGDADQVVDIPSSDAASGTSQVTIPQRFRQRVGQYFQRVAEEVGDGQ